MGRKKKSECDLSVQKSRPLHSLWESDLKLSEFKMLEIYISKIDCYDENKREVIISKNETKEMLGVDFKNIVLEERLRSLMSKTCKIYDPNKKDGYTIITLFSKAQIKYDENNECEIILKCTDDAKEYFFNIENLGYLKYSLSIIMRLKSIYSYLFFQYIEYNRFRKSWTISVENLKEILRCTADSYNDFRRFKDKVIKKSYEDIKDICNFTYKEIKSGRRVVEIEFTMNEAEIIMLEDKKDIYSLNDILNPDELQEIYNMVAILNPTNVKDYLEDVFKRFKYQYDKRKITGVFKYIKKIIDTDIENKKNNKPKNAFHNFEQREDGYTNEELEELRKKKLDEKLKKIGIFNFNNDEYYSNSSDDVKNKINEMKNAIK